MFNHSNVFIPLKLDRIIRLLIVTPDMHRVHHSVILMETDSNYGFTLSWWDRLLGTYRAQPAKGHQGMKIGLSRFLDEKRQTLLWLLALPFLKKAKKYI
jgi:sterol desaturase/sphingolipid hydroxylase (fatty acid hydroxylase superfamily)